MKRFFLWALGVIFLTSALHAQTFTNELDAYIENARKAWGCPGVAVTVVKDGKVLVAKGYGLRELGKPERVDENTLFDTASLSKSFTAAAIATLVDEGKMRWDDPLRRHLPQVEFSDAYRTASVTIRDLLAHRVGVETGNFMMRFTNHSTDEVLRRIRYLDEREPFRTNLVYWNIGYGAASEAAASAAKMPFADLLRTRLLEPLGMRDSTVVVDHTLSPNHAKSHGLIGGKLHPIRTKKLKNTQGADAVNSSAKDMARWLLFSLGDGTWAGKRILSVEAMREMHSPQMIIRTTPEMRAARGVRFFGAYGLGWQIMDLRGRKMLWHGGGADGMPVYMAILPDQQIGVAVMTNSWDAPTLRFALASRILDTLLEEEETRDWAMEALEAHRRDSARAVEENANALKSRVLGTRPSAKLEAYSGTYVDDVHGDMVIAHDAGKLTLLFGGGERADLEHWHHDVFRVIWRDRAYEWADTFAEFSLDPNIEPRRLEMQLFRDRIDAIRTSPAR
jgi:CubicO group peptidase (beta-lactamase class C family)